VCNGLAGFVLLLAACGGTDEASSPSTTSTSIPVPATTSSASTASTPPVAQTAATVDTTPTTAPLATTPGAAENGTFFGFLVAAAAGSAATPPIVAYDRVEVSDISWKPGTLDMPAMTNTNPKQRTAEVAATAAVTLLCGGPLATGSATCDPSGTVAATVGDLPRAAAADPYTWAAARSGIRTTLAYPALYQLTIAGGVVTEVRQRTAIPERRAGWLPDLGPWMDNFIEPCCGEQLTGQPSLPLPAAGEAWPHTLYAVDFYASVTGGVAHLVLHPWVTASCVADGSCGASTLDIDHATSRSVALPLDTNVVVHVEDYQCDATTGGYRGEHYVGDGTALTALLADGDGAMATWGDELRQVESGGGAVSHTLAAQLASSPFEIWPCPDSGPHGVAVYHHAASGIDVLVQSAAADFFTRPLISGFGIDDNGTIHLFWWASFRS